jgi:hypothetical protein
MLVTYHSPPHAGSHFADGQDVQQKTLHVFLSATGTGPDLLAWLTNSSAAGCFHHVTVQSNIIKKEMQLNYFYNLHYLLFAC